MKFQIGDLIITKDYRNRRVPAYIIEVHEPGSDKEDYLCWTHKSITIQYSEAPDQWTRLPIHRVEYHLNNPHKLARWYHFPVKT